MTNRTFSIVGAAMLLVMFVAAQQLDPHDFDTDAEREQREWMHAIQHCHRAWGPQTAPEYDENDRLICRSRRGEVLAFKGGKP